jgi:hypothetical protein
MGLCYKILNKCIIRKQRNATLIGDKKTRPIIRPFFKSEYLLTIYPNSLII